jgi:hypothetical protein
MAIASISSVTLLAKFESHFWAQRANCLREKLLPNSLTLADDIKKFFGGNLRRSKNRKTGNSFCEERQRREMETEECSPILTRSSDFSALVDVPSNGRDVGGQTFSQWNLAKP